MEERIEDKILAYLRGEVDYDTLQLLREAREELLDLRSRNINLGWAVETESNRADAFDPRYN